MPRPVDRRRTYIPGLDGIRAIAVAVVVAYHLGPALGYEEGLPGFSGGLLGVGVFFTLSGYLITSLLLTEREESGRIDLKRFWVRRFRRLLPAAVVMIAVVWVSTLLVDFDQIGERTAQAVAGLLYYANWHTISSGGDYFALFADIAPLDHVWSLSVEEQFYLLWPLLVFAMPIVGLRTRKTMARATLVLAGASFALLAWIGRPATTIAESAYNATRAYEGTDTRAGGLLLGAAAAMLWHRSRNVPRERSWVLRADLIGLAGLAAIGLLIATTTRQSWSLYSWGLPALSLATVAVVVAVAQRESLLGRALGFAPLRWVGERSYGIYLWHLPVIVFCADHLPATPWVRGVMLVAMILALSALSWVMIEDPMRRRGVWATITGAGWGARRGLPALRPRLTPGLRAVVAVVIVGVTATSATALLPTRVLKASTPAPAEATPTAAAAAAPAPTGPPRMDCPLVVHVGDSTSVGLTSTEYLPDARKRIDARYRAYGARQVIAEIAGARSIVERWGDAATAEEVMAYTSRTRKVAKICWVLAMGTNDAANENNAPNVPLNQRIDRLLKHTRPDDPVMWVNATTVLSSGHWSQDVMLTWNSALMARCASRPGMHVFDWASEARAEWFQRDGIHYTSRGYAARADRIARALGRAVPAEGSPPTDCLVRSA